MDYFFSLPKIIDLTIQQQSVLYEEDPVSLSGGAGTGKSVVSIYKHLQNYEKGTSSILMTYTKSLQKYLFQSIKQINPEASKRVHSAKGCLIPKNKKYCDGVFEIIIDEAQDLSYSDIKILKGFSKILSYGADFNQQLYSDCITKEEIKGLFPENEEINLEENFRNTKEIINFTKEIIPDFKINSNIEKTSEKPILFVGNDYESQVLKIIENYSSDKENIAILFPFAKNVQYLFEKIKSQVDCSCYHSKLENKDTNIKNIHITTFKSSKGLEFDTVIIPEFNNFDYYINNMDTVSKNDYYVAFTRSKTNLFLISSEDLDIDKKTYDMETF